VRRRNPAYEPAQCAIPGDDTDPREVLTRPAPPPDQVLGYGPGPDHVADLWLPDSGAAGESSRRAAQRGRRAAAPLVIFLHGGFWRAAFDRSHAGPLASALADAGYAVCVPEYRRTGQAGGGWPGTFDDVAAAVDALPGLVAEATGGLVDPAAVLLAGHSAGGHLALWTAARNLLPAGARWHSAGPSVRGVVALAAVSDLAACDARGLGGGAARLLMGGGPDRYPDRYALADPARLVPLNAPVRLVHGADDDVVPCQLSVDYAALAARAGGQAACSVLPGFGHFEVIDPLTGAWPHVLAALQALTGQAGEPG
jgi:acetyl esterase/lipase